MKNEEEVRFCREIDPTSPLAAAWEAASARTKNEKTGRWKHTADAIVYVASEKVKKKK